MEHSDDDRSTFCEDEYPKLAGALTLYTGDPELGRELAQEALARACLHWSRVRLMNAPGVWAHRVAINLARSNFARRRVERRVHRDLQAAVVTVMTTGDLATAVDLREAVAALPERQRAALVLRYYADLPVREVAGVMGCAEGSVRALTHQAIRRLKTVLAVTDPEEETQRVRLA